MAGAYSPSPGTIYPTLTLLEELGYVTVAPSEDGTKKLHAITEQGRAFLEANRPALDALLARMEEAGKAHASGDAPQIVRAMENLRAGAPPAPVARAADAGTGGCGCRRARYRRHHRRARLSRCG